MDVVWWGEDPFASPQERREDYQEFLASEEWKQTREEVFIRSKGLCQVCRKYRASQAHHMSYEHGWLNKEYLISVCSICHSRLHAKG
jgi:hypothetical protein